MAAKRKRVTLTEFKAWLEGVEELQPNDWSPSKEQWKLIRSKIGNIKESNPVEVAQAQPIAQQVPHLPQPQRLPPGLTPPPPVGGLPNGEVAMSAEAKNMLTASGAGNKTTTPTIDTSDGNFSSSFQ